MTVVAGWQLRSEMTRVKQLLPALSQQGTSASLLRAMQIDNLLCEGNKALNSGDVTDMRRVIEKLLEIK